MKRGDLIFFVFSGILMFSSFSALGREPLTFEERVKAQEAIEKVYYNHRIWPKENKTPKPAFEKMVSKETIEAKVTDYLKKSAALEKYWYRPITGEQLQAEMERMAKGTKDPATLNELFKALNDDPYLIAECLARPVLADRLVRNWYANDERFHEETRKKAEEALKHLTPENFCSYPEGEYSKMIYRLEVEGREERDIFDSVDHSMGLSEKEFAKMFQEIPEEGKISGVIEKDDCFVIRHTALKNEGEIVVEEMTFKKVSSEEWLKGQEEIKNLPKTEGNVSMSLPPMKESGCVEGWDNGILDDVPDPRSNNTAIWTGTEMIIWGGIVAGGNGTNTGARYNPATDTWGKTSVGTNCPMGRPNHTAVWTGSEMIVWGGDIAGEPYITNTGGRYNPSTDTWISTSTINNCPSGRTRHTAVWTGTEMIIWNGAAGGYCSDGGGKYNPSTDIWTTVSTTNCPHVRVDHSAIWTGSEMIVWGGQCGGWRNDGGRYNPSTDTWVLTSVGENVPSGRYRHSSIWTGTEMIVWGGDSADQYPYEVNSGGRYNPATDTWIATSTNYNCPSARCNHSVVWTGTEMIIWGGSTNPGWTNTGARYNPVTDTWISTSFGNNCPSSRENHTAVWTGTEMIVWGGFHNGVINSGARYNPVSDLWIPTSTGEDSPSARNSQTTVWTGTEMIIWGGISNNYQSFSKTGGKYSPSLDSWQATTTLGDCPSSRTGHTAVWTGNEMIIWGGSYWDGDGNHYFNSGSRYNPQTDTWCTTSTEQGNPTSRWAHEAVWSGSEMIIWGGDGPEGAVNTGALYNPASNSWNSTAIVNCPSIRAWHTAQWTGTEMLIWGGAYSDAGGLYHYLNDGGKYNPADDSWVTISSSGSCPSARRGHTAIWTGQEMIVWGGEWSSEDGSLNMVYNDGGRYNPLTDTWQATSIGANVPSERLYQTAVWTGSQMIVWGGWGQNYIYLDSGGQYNISSDTWLPTVIEIGCPIGRTLHTAIWTGSKMIVWGGLGDGSYQSGGIYSPGTALKPSLQGDSLNVCPLICSNLSVTDYYSTYQWNLNDSPISGATSSTYEATVSGSYTVSVTDSNGCSGTSDPHVVTITPCIPNILYQSHGTFSQVTGDGDSYFERGEKWSVPVTVTNSGNTPATGVTAALSGNGITVCNATGSFGTIAAGATGAFTYSFVIDDDFTPCGGNINFNLGSKTSTELTPAGADETNLFSVQVGQIAAGVPTDLVLQPSTADSYVNQASAGTNYGSGTTMSVQSRVSQAHRTLVRFDLSGIPEDSVINSATLELYASSAPTTGLTLNVHRITGTWTESGVTWTNQPAYNSTVDASLAGGTTAGWKIWNIASVVQDWIEGTSVNYGLIVKGSVENDKTALTYAFSSKENGTSGNRPILRVNYTPPTTVNCDYVGSGECDAVLAECAPGDTYENGQIWSGTSQSWPALFGATGYKLYRGIQSGLPNLLTTGNDSCLRYEGSTTSVDLSSDDPSGDSGRMYWYIVTGTNGSGEGSAGNSRTVNSSGNCE